MCYVNHNLELRIYGICLKCDTRLKDLSTDELNELMQEGPIASHIDGSIFTD